MWLGINKRENKIRMIFFKQCMWKHIYIYIHSHLSLPEGLYVVGCISISLRGAFRLIQNQIGLTFHHWNRVSFSNSLREVKRKERKRGKVKEEDSQKKKKEKEKMVVMIVLGEEAVWGGAVVLTSRKNKNTCMSLGNDHYSSPLLGL